MEDLAPMDGAAGIGVAVLRQQRDVDDPDLPCPAGEIEASGGLAVPEDDQKIAAPLGPLVGWGNRGKPGN